MYYIEYISLEVKNKTKNYDLVLDLVPSFIYLGSNAIVWCIKWLEISPRNN